MTADALTSPEYLAVLEALKERLRTAQLRAAVAVNRELVLLYWSIGREILTRQAELGWGAKVIDQISKDLRRAFPEMKGLSPRNLKYMRAFAEAWPEEPIVQQLVAQIPWGHIVRILDKATDPQERLFYAQKAAEHGWSRSILLLQMDSDLYRRQGKAITNFQATLPAPRSDLAQQTLKDPYLFDFLQLGDEAQERDLERAMVRHIQDTLLEMGAGFSFVGRQVRLDVGGDEFFLDLLFYHLKLHCYVVVELKVVEFQPEHAGKLNFYLSAVDEQIRDPQVDGPSIGIMLCRSKNRLVAEYALRDIHKPIGVADIHFTRLLPDDLRRTLPTVEDLERELERQVADTVTVTDHVSVEVSREPEGTDASDGDEEE
jgi:predicted nuclease of restriction endonuclease-like (RecB) superfamily